MIGWHRNTSLTWSFINQWCKNQPGDAGRCSQQLGLVAASLVLRPAWGQLCCPVSQEGFSRPSTCPSRGQSSRDLSPPRSLRKIFSSSWADNGFFGSLPNQKKKKTQHMLNLSFWGKNIKPKTCHVGSTWIIVFDSKSKYFVFLCWVY